MDAQAIFDALPPRYLAILKLEEARMDRSLEAKDFPCFECPYLQNCEGLRYDLYNLDTMAGIDCLAAK